MKSKTLCCKSSLLKHDITRFFPVWVLYSLFLCLTVIFPMNTTHNTYLRMSQLGDEVIVIILANFAYALLNALILFGDLFKTRMCYALHAMPVKRDSFYWAHMGAGLLFSVVPNLIVTFILMAQLPEYALYVWGWFAAAMGSYLFFFTLAVLCVMLSGNYIGSILIYGIINFFAVLFSWYVTQVCGSLLYGVKISDEFIMNFCPVWKMARHTYIEAKLADLYTYPDYVLESVSFAGGFRALGIYTAVGVVLMAAAQVLYRSRGLECAGDLVAIEKSKPVFLVLFTLTVGAFFHLFGQMITQSTALLFLPVGLVVGYTAGQMLLQKQLNVWKLKTFIPLAAILAVLALAMGITALDPLGLVTYIPGAAEIQGVRVDSQTMDREGYGSDPERKILYCEDGRSIDDALKLHSVALESRKLQHHSSWATIFVGVYSREDYEMNVPVCITYHLKNGKDVRRYYMVSAEGETQEELMRLFSAPEIMLGVHTAEELPTLVENLVRIEMESAFAHGGGFYIDDPEKMRGMLEALYADCKAGTTTNYYQLHTMQEGDAYLGWLYLTPKQGASRDFDFWYHSYNVYTQNENLMNWLETNGYHLPTRAEVESTDGEYAYG